MFKKEFSNQVALCNGVCMSGGVLMGGSLWLGWIKATVGPLALIVNGWGLADIELLQVSVVSRDWIIAPTLAALVILVGLIGLISANTFCLGVLFLGGLSGIAFSVWKIMHLSIEIGLQIPFSLDFIKAEAEIGLFAFFLGALLVSFTGLVGLSCYYSLREE